MRAKYLAICVTCGVLAGLLYYVYLLAITPVINGVVEETSSIIDRISEQTTTSTDDELGDSDNKISD